MSEIGSIQVMSSLWCCCLLRQLDHTTIVESQCADSIASQNSVLVLRNIFLVNGLVYGINLLKFYVRGTITHILGNLERHAIGTRPYFRPSVQLEKIRPGTEALTQ